MEFTIYDSVLPQLRALQPEIYQITKSHGFWEDGGDRNRYEMVMLMITELSEAVEAHRKSRTLQNVQIDATSTDAHYYESTIKGTVEEEVADTVIRILDYMYGFDITLYKVLPANILTGNFASDVLSLVWQLLPFADDVSESPIRFSTTLASIIQFCEFYNINLLQHVRLKLDYNRNRPYKHGKAY